MLKRITIYTVIFGLLLFLGSTLHANVLATKNIHLDFSLFNVYVFHAVFSFMVCVIFSFMALKDKWFHQLGFIYLVVLVVKIAVFFGVFYRSIFSLAHISKTDSMSLLIPMGIFLIAEVYFIARILNSK